MSLHMSSGIDKLKKMKRKLLISFLILLHITPIWLIKYFPSQDGPSHLYNAQILKEYNNPDYKFSEYYDLNLTLFPNWFSHLSLAALMYIFTPLIAEKVLLSIYIVLFPLSLFYLLNATEKKKTLFGFLGFLYIYNYLFHMGFYNFVFSVPLFFFIVGYWWKNRDYLHYQEIIVLNILLWATYLCHLVSYLLAIISLFVLSVAYFRKKAKKILLNFFYLSPSYLPFLNYAFSSDFLKSSRAPLGFWRLPQLIIDFIWMKSLVSYSKHQFIITYFLSALIAFFFFYTVWKEKITLKENVVQIRLNHKDYFLLLSGLMLILYFFMPTSMGGGGFISERLSLLPSLVILPWFSENHNRNRKRILLALIVILCIINVVCVSYYYIILNKDMEEFTSGIKLIEENKVILPLPLDPYGKSFRIGIFFNSFSYYCLSDGGINLGNYEAQTFYFPVKYKSDFERPPTSTILHAPRNLDFDKYASFSIDYVIIWGEDSAVESEVEKHWTLIKSTDRLKVFRN